MAGSTQTRMPTLIFDIFFPTLIFMQILFNALVQASLYTDRGLRITPVYWQAQWKVVLPLDMSVL